MAVDGRTGRLVAAACIAVVAVAPALAGFPADAQSGVPDILPGLARPVERGTLVVTELGTRTPTPKVVDGDIGDWVGTPARLAGNSHYDAGEFLHTDFLWDAHGADAGEDVQRWNDFAFAFHAEERANRADALLRTLEMQLGVPYPIGADEMYGNHNRGLDLADMYDVRIAANDDTVHVLVRTTVMHPSPDMDVHSLGVLLLADTGPGGSPADPALGLPEDHRFDVVVPVSTGALGQPDGVEIALNHEGWTNAVEISVPAALVAPDGVLDLSIITGQVHDDLTFTPLNIAFRHSEPIDIYNDRRQAFALHGDAPDGSHLNDFSSGPIDLDDLRSGRTQAVRPGPGYHERQFLSGENISAESGRNGIVQPYGLYVPGDFEPTAPTPTTFWLHYRGGKTHSGATINPRLIHELAREDPAGLGLGGQGTVVVTPNARGTSFWYVAHSHQDFFEVFSDVHDLLPNIDPRRRTLAGYSMGGYGTYLMAGLYPDLFAAGYPTSGAVTQGAWTGVHDSPLCDFRMDVGGDEGSPCFLEANSGNADAQLTYRILENTLHVPMHIDHGTNDELVPVTGVQRMALRLVELGHRVQMQTFPGYEHFTQAAVDEWANGAAHLERFAAPENPRRVVYKVVPALTWAVNTIRWDGEPFDFNPDGAYWVDGIVVRDPDPEDPTSFGLVEATSLAIDEDPHVLVPVAGVAAFGHSTPYVLYGQDWLADPLSTTEPANAFTATLTGVARVTFDATRMGIDPDVPLSGTMTTDGPATVTLSSFWPGSGTLSCDCGIDQPVAWSGEGVDLALTAAGTWVLTALLDGSATDPGDPEGPSPPPPVAADRELPATGGGLPWTGAMVLLVLAAAGIAHPGGRATGHGS